MLEYNILVMIKLDSYIVKMIVIGKHSDYDGSITYYVIIISYNHWTQLKIIITNKNNNKKKNMTYIKVMIVKNNEN